MRMFEGPLLLLLTLGLLLQLVGGPGLCRNAAATGTDERQAVETAARQYLDAEIRRDHPVIYGMLAPSSVYCETHDYRAYLAEAEASPVRITAYRILAVSALRWNDDPVRYPRVERFAQVEVDVTVFFADTGTTSEVNYSFTFIKEGGKWLKG